MAMARFNMSHGTVKVTFINLKFLTVKSAFASQVYGSQASASPQDVWYIARSPWSRDPYFRNCTSFRNQSQSGPATVYWLSILL